MNRLLRTLWGVTLVELMVVLAVLGVLLSLAAPSFADLLNRRRVQMVADQLVTDLAYARSEAAVGLAAVDTVFVDDASQSCYALIYWGSIGAGCDCTRGPGSACDNSSPASGTFTTSREIRSFQMRTNSGVRFVSTGNWDALSTKQVRFVPPQLRPTVADFAVEVIGIRGYKLNVRLNAAGRVSQCSPDGSMPGAAPC